VSLALSRHPGVLVDVGGAEDTASLVIRDELELIEELPLNRHPRERLGDPD
jgi:hypothetical protein